MLTAAVPMVDALDADGRIDAKAVANDWRRVAVAAPLKLYLRLMLCTCGPLHPRGRFLRVWVPLRTAVSVALFLQTLLVATFQLYHPLWIGVGTLADALSFVDVVVGAHVAYYR